MIVKNFTKFITVNDLFGDLPCLSVGSGYCNTKNQNLKEIISLVLGIKLTVKPEVALNKKDSSPSGDYLENSVYAFLKNYILLILDFLPQLHFNVIY